DEKDTTSEPCRFAASIAPGAICAKPGGVCTIRKYREVDGVIGIVTVFLTLGLSLETI
ncbi:NotI family restriction endonuclease, partial [Nostoc sp. CHAB 5715]|uniref:NotI family restriction endonuclease n=1 Tax=Nostoc sp. CHAB 5715 TaxID=2780400 RepID=UPI0034D36FCC